jgi:hypothetical protein
MDVRFLGGAREDGRSGCGLQRTSESLRDADEFRAACAHARFLEKSTRNGQPKRIADKQTAIVTTAGMLANEDSLAVAAV